MRGFPSFQDLLEIEIEAPFAVVVRGRWPVRFGTGVAHASSDSEVKLPVMGEATPKAFDICALLKRAAVAFVFKCDTI